MTLFLRVLLLVGVVAVLAAAFDWATRAKPGRAAVTAATNADPVGPQLVMYGMTTCAPCKVRAAELRAAGIAFTEYMIDVDASARALLEARLRNEVPPGATVGTPIFEISGELIFGNPPVTELQRRLGTPGRAPVSFFRS